MMSWLTGRRTGEPRIGEPGNPRAGESEKRRNVEPGLEWMALMGHDLALVMVLSSVVSLRPSVHHPISHHPESPRTTHLPIQKPPIYPSETHPRSSFAFVVFHVLLTVALIAKCCCLFACHCLWHTFRQFAYFVKQAGAAGLSICSGRCPAVTRLVVELLCLDFTLPSAAA